MIDPSVPFPDVVTITQRGIPPHPPMGNLTLPLTAEERTRSRHRLTTLEAVTVEMRLPRGTVLRDGDWLTTAALDVWVQVIAKPEPVLTAIAPTPLLGLRAAYHLGNRHVPLEITATYLRLSPDPVLHHLLEHLGLEVRVETMPFQPEVGAYHAHGNRSESTAAEAAE